MRSIITLLLAGILSLTGCAAHMVVNPGAQSNSPYAPVNEDTRPGIIKYLNADARPVREARRNDAYHQMYEACSGKYRILREGMRLEGGVIMPAGDGAIYADSQDIYIEFQCVTQ